MEDLRSLLELVFLIGIIGGGLSWMYIQYKKQSRPCGLIIYEHTEKIKQVVEALRRKGTDYRGQDELVRVKMTRIKEDLYQETRHLTKAERAEHQLALESCVEQAIIKLATAAPRQRLFDSGEQRRPSHNSDIEMLEEITNDTNGNAESNIVAVGNIMIDGRKINDVQGTDEMPGGEDPSMEMQVDVDDLLDDDSSDNEIGEDSDFFDEFGQGTNEHNLERDDEVDDPDSAYVEAEAVDDEDDEFSEDNITQSAVVNYEQGNQESLPTLEAATDETPADPDETPQPAVPVEDSDKEDEEEDDWNETSQSVSQSQLEAEAEPK